jgi:hypothetical protein
MRTRVVATALAAVACVSLASIAAAQQRPLVTEDPETVGSGIILLEGGVEYGHDQFFPASGLTGNLLKLPVVGASVGISSIAEIHVSGGFYNRLSITKRAPAPLSDMLNVSGDSTSDVEDIVIATKIRLFAETSGRPSVGLRFATRLPNAGNESGLGLDTTDFHVIGTVGKTVQSIRVVGNFGLGILGDPTRGDRQNDVVLYGVSLARAIQQGLEVVGEINGRANTRSTEAPVGTESRSVMRIGTRFTRGAVRVDGALLFGLTSRDPSYGFTVGATYVFKGFTVP